MVGGPSLRPGVVTEDGEKAPWVFCWKSAKILTFFAATLEYVAAATPGLPRYILLLGPLVVY